MCRTVVNVTGDMVACVTIDRMMPEETTAEPAAVPPPPGA
jgi:Na+/H+-dicarboxylate symporter